MSDVLKLLGKTFPATEPEIRDAIHIAVILLDVEAKVFAGQKVGVTNGKADPDAPAKVGIVDPFLQSVFVFPGTKVFVYLFPGTITSLHHVWEHPAFPPSDPINPPNEGQIHEQLVESRIVMRDNPEQIVEITRLQGLLADKDRDLEEMRAENVRLAEAAEKAPRGTYFKNEREAKEWLQGVCDSHDVDLNDVWRDIVSSGSYTQRGSTSLESHYNDGEDQAKVYEAVEWLSGQRVERQSWGPFSCSC